MKKSAVTSWVLYDFANSIYSTGVLSLYGGLWATKYLEASEAAYGATLSMSMVLVAVFAPWVGALSDRARSRTPFTLGFTVMCCLATALMGFVNHAILGLVLLGLSNIFYQIAAVPYNAQLPEIVAPHRVGLVSGWGAGFNALGSTVAALAVPKLAARSAGEIVRQSAFVPIAGLFALFSLPLGIWTRGQIREERPPAENPGASSLPSWSGVWRDLYRARHIPGLWDFMIANLLILDAGSTIVSFFALYAVNGLGFSEAAGEPAKLMATAAMGGFLSGPIWGWASDRFGPKTAMVADAFLWLVLFATMPFVTVKLAYFLFFGPGAGAAIAGIVAAGRPMLAHLTPAEKRGEYFGMLALVGRLAAILGPTTWGAITTSLATHGFFRYQVAMGSLFALTMVGMLFLLRVPNKRAPNG